VGLRILVWHVHGSWTTAFIQGGHTYLVPVVPDRSADGRGRARTWDWPPNAVERTPAQLADEQVDLVVLQRPADEPLARAWLGRQPGRDVPAVWVEHNAPQGRVADLRHPAADRDDLVVVHVTHTNALFWDCGRTRTTVIDHGVVDPGHRFTGELARAAVAINEPGRRGRVVGADLLPGFASTVPIDLYGMGVAGFVDALGVPSIVAHEDLPQVQLHEEMARRRVYLHPFRWTSLGLSLIEAMHLGLPVVALATTEVPDAVPSEAGVVTNRPDVLHAALRRYAADPEEAAVAGKAGRAAAIERFGLDRFLSDWEELFQEMTR
jgi:glycosyltransferase involved in cell wall biosynthesis